ncbi:MAG: hypothetical protein IPG64_20940 [Haliea sp.]|nr:hypothetical protein [Haliea sp.]
MLIIPGPIDTEIWDKVEDENAYRGKKFLRNWSRMKYLAIAERRFEVTVPRRNLQLVTARLFAMVLPALVRKGCRENRIRSSRSGCATPVPRARKGLRMGLGDRPR